MHRLEPRIHSGTRALLLTASLLLAGCAATGSSPTRAPPATPPLPASSPSAANGDARVLGAATAPVVIIEFTDLQCPYCARFALETWPTLRERYIDTGKVRFASRDLPLSFHPYAVPAAVAARCAGEQGRFFDYREALFRVQTQLADAPYDALAERHGLDLERFAACRRSEATVAAVRADAAFAMSNGIGSTPTFVIGREIDGQFVGEAVAGALPLEAFVERIEALLREAQQQ
jgi:protein-disulfide isomerase